MDEGRYSMRLSLNILNHVGLHLYSNTPAVLAETIANAWDADATEVRVSVDTVAKTISVADNGVGMDLKDINERFLYVGYAKRSDTNGLVTQRGRRPMGRKGIGKLSLFSIAETIRVYTKKVDAEPESFKMNSGEIETAITTDDPSAPKVYKPTRIRFDENIADHGTTVRIGDLKRARLTSASANALRKRIARRFTVLGDSFRILVNGEEVTFQDRDYFHKARFIFQYGGNYADHCSNLDTDSETRKSMKYDRGPAQFTATDDAGEEKRYAVRGWVAIARRSNDLDGETRTDNLNKIAIVVRGKVAQEDILQDFRLGGMITKYMFGEFNADFLDDDEEEDIATSSRQSISEDDFRFKGLKSFVGEQLRHIWNETNKLKERKGLENALKENPPLKEWYDGLPSQLKPKAKKIFGAIDSAIIEEDKKGQFYANGVLAFEHAKMDNALEVLDMIDEENAEEFLQFLANIDAIEAAEYREIVKNRLRILEKLQQGVQNRALERVLEEYLFKNLWLLDPAWERATEYENMEKRIQSAVLDEQGRARTLRTDIRYRRVAGAHVVLELKRGGRRLTKLEIEGQLSEYRKAVRAEVEKDPKQAKYPVEGVCIVGELPQGWDKLDDRKDEEASLRAVQIRVMTYSELIDNAESAYAKFLKATSNTENLNTLLDSIRGYTPKVDEEEPELEAVGAK